MNCIYLHLKARDWLASRDVTYVTVNVADMAEVKGQFNLTSHFIVYITKRSVTSSGFKQDWLLSLVCVSFGWISYLCGCLDLRCVSVSHRCDSRPSVHSSHSFVHMTAETSCFKKGCFMSRLYQCLCVRSVSSVLCGAELRLG